MKHNCTFLKVQELDIARQHLSGVSSTGIAYNFLLISKVNVFFDVLKCSL